VWVSLFTGAPTELVGPLVESLEHRMVAGEDRLVEMAGIELTAFETSMREAWEYESEEREDPVALGEGGSTATSENTVRSVQRLPMPEGANAWWVADEYARWLPDFMAPFLRVEVDEDRRTRFFVRGMSKPLLDLKFDNVSRSDRQLFWIVGGLLARRQDRGRLEFREVLGGRAVLAAIHDFQPRLPWWIYRFTQVLVHLFVMKSYGRHLARIDRVETPQIECEPGAANDPEAA